MNFLLHPSLVQVQRNTRSCRDFIWEVPCNISEAFCPEKGFRFAGHQNHSEPQECLCKWHLGWCSCARCSVKVTGNKETTVISVFKVDWVLADVAQCCRKMSSLPPDNLMGLIL